MVDCRLRLLTTLFSDRNNLMNESIENVLFKFANSFDLKAWQALEDTLMDTIECDYQDLRGISKTHLKSEFVSLRKQALQHLKTQHLFSNLEITVQEDRATCQLSAVIFRQDNDGKQFNSHVMYHFYLVQLQKDEWRIKKIKQSVLWNEGDSSIHKGVAG